MVAAAFIGPGTVTTATISGAGYGYTLLWAVVFSVFATYVLQEMSARLGTVAQMGVGRALRQKINNKGFRYVSFALVISAIVIGNAAYEAGNITGAVLGFPRTPIVATGHINPLVILIAIGAFAILFTGKYKLIERALVGLVSVMGIVFIVCAVLASPDWVQVLEGMFMPVIPEGALKLVLGLIGTTVVPYNLFLHASSASKRWSGPEDLGDARWDTVFSVLVGGLITMAILITSAAAFSESPRAVNSATDLAMQLKPILGSWSESFIAIGFLAAGTSSAVTAPLAAAFATSEILGWGNQMNAGRFRLVWIFVLMTGVILSSLGIRPTVVILFAQVANGLLLPFIASFLLWVANDKGIMGSHTNNKTVNVLAAAIILVTFGLGLKGILSAFSIF